MKTFSEKICFVLAAVIILPLCLFSQQPDTVYSQSVTSHVLLDGQALPDATIKYTLMDTVNGTHSLIREALTDELGQDVVDSLPILKHSVGIQPINNKAYDGLVITNNGTGSDHLIRFTSDAQEVSKECYIINLLGQKVTSIPVQYNSATKTFDAVWHGQSVQNGIYLFYVPASNGPIADKIIHIKNTPGIIEYGVAPEVKEELKIIDEISDLATSKYAINITREGVEDFVDTVWVYENTPHDFFFNVTGVQYADGDMWGQIFFVQGGQSPTDANVEYKRLLDPSMIFNTTAPNGVYNIQVPVFFEPLNPGETKYIVTISENGDPFITEIDTVLVSPGVGGTTHYVTQQATNPEQDIEGIVKHVYTKQPESGVTVRVIDRTTGSLIEEDITGTDGSYFFANIAAGTLVEFELGKSGELWNVNNEYDIPTEIGDTLVTFNRYFYPKNVEVPEVGTNTTILGDGEEVGQLVGTDKVNFEEILRNIDYMWANGSYTDYTNARVWIENYFYEGNSPITTANTQRNITATMQQNYEPYTNFYPGQLGWNVNFGSGNTTLPLFSTTNYGVTAIIGGEIMTTGGGSNSMAPVIKEIQGRRMWLGVVSGRTSFMNSNPSMPTEKDRAYVHMILINQNGRFDVDEETYSLENLTSVEPTSKASTGMSVKDPPAGRAGKPQPGAEYHDVPGNKPHSKEHINQEKLDAQYKVDKPAWFSQVY